MSSVRANNHPRNVRDPRRGPPRALEIALGVPAPRPERCGYHKLSEAQRRTQERRSQSLPRGACQSLPRRAGGIRWSIQIEIHRAPALSHRHRMQRREQHAVHT